MIIQAFFSRLFSIAARSRALGWVPACLAAGLMAGNPADSRVSLKLTSVPLEHALQRAASQAGVHLVYADALLEGITVDCHVRKQPLREVLPHLLEHTAIGFRWVKPYRVVLFADKSKTLITVAGAVLDAASGRPLAGAVVSLPGAGRVTLSDSRGSFSLPAVSKPLPTLHIDLSGYAPRDLALPESHDPGELQIPLTAIPHVSEHLEISPSRNLPLQYSPRPNLMTISPTELSGIPGHDLFESLSMIPGLGTGPGEGGVGIRGGRPSENLVLLDGIMLYHMDHALGFLSALNTDAIEDIQLYKGVYPAQYGGRLSGVLDLSTKGDRPDQREIQAGFDRDIAKVTLVQPLGNHLSLMVSARRSLSQEPIYNIYERVFQYTFNNIPRTIETNNGLKAPRNIHFSDSIAKLTWRPNPADTFSLTLFQGEDITAEAILFDLFGWEGNLYTKEGEWGNEGGSARWIHRWRNRSRSSVHFVRSEYLSNFDFQEPVFPEEYLQEGIISDISRPWWTLISSNTRNQLEEEALRLTHSWPVNERHELDFGLTSSDLYARYFYDFRGEDTFQAQRHTQQTAFFIQDRWRPNAALQVVAGIRGMSNSLTDSQHLEPRLALQYALSSHLSARASWGEYRQYVLRSPDTLNYFEGVETWFLADGHVRPGKSRQFQIGSRYETYGWAVDVEAYLKLQEGSLLRLFDPLLEGNRLRQSVDRIRGIELVLQKQAERFSGWVGYRFQKAQVVGELISETPSDYPTDLDSPHHFNLVLNHHRDRWQASTAWRYASGRPYSIPRLKEVPHHENLFQLRAPRIPNNQRLPPSHQLDLSLRYLFTWVGFEGQLGLSLLNVYDRTNILYRYYTNEGLRLVPVDVPGFGFQPSLQLQTRF